MYNHQYYHIEDVNINRRNKIYFSKEKELKKIVELLDEPIEKNIVEKPIDEKKILILDSPIDIKDNYIESRIVEITNKEITL